VVAVFEPSTGSFDEFRYPRGGVFGVTNEQSARLGRWESGVRLFKSGARIAVVLRYAHDRPELLELASATLLDRPDDAAPDIPESAPPGMGLVGRITVIPREPDGPLVLRIPRADEDREPDDAGTSPSSAESAPSTAAEESPGSPSDDAEAFSALAHACEFCSDFRGPTRARVERHIEFNHPEAFAATTNERAALAAAERLRREQEERIRTAEPPPEPPPWEREAVNGPT
jgi:hypothetical protein